MTGNQVHVLFIFLQNSILFLFFLNKREVHLLSDNQTLKMYIVNYRLWDQRAVTKKTTLVPLATSFRKISISAEDLCRQL